MKSNGFGVPKIFCVPNWTARRSATNSMYWVIITEFMPISAQGREFTIKSFSSSTASLMILWINAWGRDSSVWYSATANCVCRPSSREMSSLLNVSPGSRPRFLSQKMEQNAPEKKMPSTQAKAIKRVWKSSGESIHLLDQSAFCPMHGIVSMALKRRIFSSGSLMYVSISREYVSEWIPSMAF